MRNITTMYRYESMDIREDAEAPCNPRIRCDDYFVLALTDRGVWIRMPGFTDTLEPRRKWVSLHSKKRYAYPTKAEAWEAFAKRTQRRIEILRYQLHYAETLMRAIDERALRDVLGEALALANDESREGVKMGLSGP